MFCSRLSYFLFRLGNDWGSDLLLTCVITLVDPNLDADDAVGSLGFGEAIVDIGTQGMQRHAAFAIPLGTCDLDTVQTATAHDLDALRAQTHRILHRTLHGAAEHDAFFELLS